MDEELKVFINGKILPIKEANISVFDRGFQYGDGVFEGLRCYDGKIFKLKGSNPTRLPGLISESVLLWDKIRIRIYRMKHGRLKISSLNPGI